MSDVKNTAELSVNDEISRTVNDEISRKNVIKIDHLLLDKSVNKEDRSLFLNPKTESFNKAIQDETGAKIYDEYVHDKILFSEDNIYSFNPVYTSAIPSQNHYSFNSIQKWEGVVTEVGEDTFTARLTDLTNGGSGPSHGGPSHGDEFIELSFDDVSSPDDIELIQKGAIFYWNIGFETLHGQDRKSSLIRFRRLPKWSKKKLEAMERKGKEIINQIQWK